MQTEFKMQAEKMNLATSSLFVTFIQGVTNRSKSMIEKLIDISILFDTDESIS